MSNIFKIEFTLESDGDIIISNGFRSARVVIDTDYRDVLDQIETKKIVEWKGEELLKEFSKDELKNYLEYEYGE